jgi:hypothetical protein
MGQVIFAEVSAEAVLRENRQKPAVVYEIEAEDSEIRLPSDP